MKILAMYLPQFHTIPENDKWWGRGYTEWTAVKNAQPLYKNHKEPRIPLEKNYYDLADETGEVWKWQAELAKKYGVYGFCIYHYWFEGKQLLQKPMEILLKHPEIDINYCICWANETWRKNWYTQEKTILIEQTYGEKEAWQEHFNYLKDFFLDPRYIKIQNKPVINIYHSQDILKLQEMRELWDHMAQKIGFSGVYIISGLTGQGGDNRQETVDAQYVFEPGYTLKNRLNTYENIRYIVATGGKRFLNSVFHTHFVEHIVNAYEIYKHIEDDDIPDNAYPGTFPQWDNTPRTGIGGLSYTHTSPQIFAKHLKILANKYRNKDFLYINAWNEWGEGAYLEPDEDYKYGFLETVREIEQ